MIHGYLSFSSRAIPTMAKTSICTRCSWIQVAPVVCCSITKESSPSIMSSLHRKVLLDYSWRFTAVFIEHFRSRVERFLEFCDNAVLPSPRLLNNRLHLSIPYLMILLWYRKAEKTFSWLSRPYLPTNTIDARLHLTASTFCRRRSLRAYRLLNCRSPRLIGSYDISILVAWLGPCFFRRQQSVRHPTASVQHKILFLSRSEMKTERTEINHASG